MNFLYQPLSSSLHYYTTLLLCYSTLFCMYTTTYIESHPLLISIHSLVSNNWIPMVVQWVLIFSCLWLLAQCNVILVEGLWVSFIGLRVSCNRCVIPSFQWCRISFPFIHVRILSKLLICLTSEWRIRFTEKIKVVSEYADLASLSASLCLTIYTYRTIHCYPQGQNLRLTNEAGAVQSNWVFYLFAGFFENATCQLPHMV